jgi:DNA-binding MarR family transcriptional regulator
MSVSARTPTKGRAAGSVDQPTVARQFLELYFPFHYEVGFAVEREMRDPRLTQQQNVILWILRSTGDDGRELSRKTIEARLGPWFDVTSSAMSKALRGMAEAPLALLTIEEHPRSGREKTVRLTAAGLRAVAGMVRRGEAYIARIVAELSDQEVPEGLKFLDRVSNIVRRF